MLFDDLTDTQRDEVVAASTPQQLKAHDILAQQGAPATTFYVVEVGQLRVSQSDDSGREVIGRTIGPGRAFGGAVAAGRPRYPTSARALQPVRVLGWARPMLMALLDKYPQLRDEIVKDEARPAEARERQQEANTGSVAQRLARILISVSINGSRLAGASIDIVHPLTRQDLATLAGAELFDVAPVLSDWEKRGVISMTRSHVRILNPAELQEAAEAQ